MECPEYGLRYMAKKSEKPRRGRISATEASRSFATLLDEVEKGGTFLVHRRGKDVCLMSPPPLAARRISQCLEIVRGRPPILLDDRFASDLLAILETEPIENRPWGS
jgi:antitoxin (DNA-binding transcriptional repressor) of toxin-antitoxin stability system